MENSFRKTVSLNIGGTVFKCYDATLSAFPDTKLAKLDEQTDTFDSEQNEYFFDRNPILFAYILDSLRKGAVHLPKDACGITFKKELEFWEISPHYVAPCCWEALYRSEDDIATVNSLVRYFQQNSNLSLMFQRKLDFRTKLWLFLDEPRSSRLALIWSVFISIVLVAATLADGLGTVESFQENFTESHIVIIKEFADSFDFENVILQKEVQTKPVAYLLLTNAVCHAILTIELLLSFIVCHNKKAFICSLPRIVACFGYLSYWIGFTIYFNIGSTHAFMVQFVFKYLSIFKLARLFYITKSVPAFRLISLTFRSSKQELKVLVFLLGILVCVFGYVLFAAERFHNSSITDIFTAIYWALITLTTVGYGDFVPSTTAGHVIAGACAVCGILVLALPVGIIVSKFNKYYSYHQYTHIHAERFSKFSLSESSGLMTMEETNS